MPRDLWYQYQHKTLYARYNVSIARERILDTRAGAITEAFLPVGSAVEVEEFTADHLALRWVDRTLFLLLGDPDRGPSLKDQIEAVFARDPAGARLDWLIPERKAQVRRRVVAPGMRPEEVTVSWGPPPCRVPGSGGGDATWLYAGEGNWRVRVEFAEGLVTSVKWEEGESPLVPRAYQGPTPEKRRPYLPW